MSYICRCLPQTKVSRIFYDYHSHCYRNNFNALVHKPDNMNLYICYIQQVGLWLVHRYNQSACIFEKKNHLTIYFIDFVDSKLRMDRTIKEHVGNCWNGALMFGHLQRPLNRI